MLRSWRYVAAWMAATAAAVTVSWLGVRVGVAPALTAEAPVAIDVDRRYTEVRLGPPDVVPEPGAAAVPAASTPPAAARATPVAPASGRPAPSRPAPARSAAAPPAAAPPAAAPPAPAPPAPGRSAPARSPGTAGPAAGQSAPAEPRPRAAATSSPTRTSAPDRRPRYRIRAQGGVVTVAYSATRVDVVATDPITGYTAGVDRRGERLLVIRLAGPTHASVVTVYWLGGPGARIMEEYAR